MNIIAHRSEKEKWQKREFTAGQKNTRMVAMRQYIVIAGNIGAGKSTLVERLCSTLNWEPYYEPVSDNPYLEDFYQDMKAWAFHSQLYFLSDRLQTHKRLQEFSGPVVQDRSVFEDAEIFARNLYEQGAMTDRDFTAYMKVYKLFLSFIEPPDLVVYLQSSLQTLRERIALRGRDYESGIQDDYLLSLNRLYEKWIDVYDLSPVLTINTGSIDIVERPEDLDRVVALIYEAMKGKQEELFSAMDPTVRCSS